MRRCAVLLGALLASTSAPAVAIPAFERQTGLKCGACHTLPPVLNRFGRDFLENGYRLTREWARERGEEGTGESEEPAASPRPLSHFPVSLRLRLNALAAQPEETLEFRIPSLSVEVGLPFGRAGSFWTDFFLKTGDQNARLGDVVVGYHGLLGDRLDVRVGQLSPPLLIESQRRLLIDLPDVYARGSLVNGWFLARRRLGLALLPRVGRLQPGLYLFQEDSDSDLDVGRPDWAGTLEWSPDRHLILQLYGYLGDVIVRPAGAPSFRDKFRQGTASVEYLRGRWHLLGAYSTGRHENADGTGTRSTNAGFFAEANLHTGRSAAAILRFDHGDNPLLSPRRLTAVTLGFTKRGVNDRLRGLVELRLVEGSDNDRIAAELEVNL